MKYPMYRMQDCRIASTCHQELAAFLMLKEEEGQLGLDTGAILFCIHNAHTHYSRHNPFKIFISRDDFENALQKG